MRSFCIAKASLIFSTKNISVFGYKVIKHLTSWPLNELVKLTMLWTTGPWTADKLKYSQVLISQTLLSHCIIIYQGILFGHISHFPYISTSVTTNYWYLKVNFLEPENLLWDISSLGWTSNLRYWELTVLSRNSLIWVIVCLAFQNIRE